MQSIFDQSYRNLEVIIVDNHSSDKTAKIAEKYGVRICSKGPERSSQINEGVEVAEGKYVYRVDSDFVLDSDVVRQAVEACEREGYDAIAIHNTSDHTASLWARVRKVERDYYRNDDTNIASRFWKKEVFEKLGGFDASLVAAEDYDFHNRLVEAGYKVGRIQAEELHIGEPRNLAEVVQKHYYYGKNIGSFIKKNTRKALKQLGPFRQSYFRAFSSSIGDPMLATGFVIYQVVRYTATGFGLIARIIGASKDIAE